MSDETFAIQLVKRLKLLKRDRNVWDDLLQEVMDYFLPHDSDFNTLKARGERRTRQIFDSTGPHALQLAASGLYSRASNPAQKWFDLRFSNPKFNKEPKGERYLEESRDILLDVINKELAAALFQTYIHLLGPGTAVLFMEEDPETFIKGRVLPLNRTYIAENHRGEVDTVFRAFHLTARQAKQKWPGGLGPKLAMALEKNPEKEFEFVHAVFPREDFDATKLGPKGMPFSSVFISTTDQNIVEQGGYHEFPFAIPRFDIVAGEIYGRSPAMMALPDVRTINEMVRLTLDAANMAIRPPLDVPHETYITPIQLTPAAININQDEQGRKITPITAAGDPRISFSMIEERRAAIRQIFFNDQLQLINGPQMTATEVVERVNQQMLLLGPTHGRLENELFEKVVDRVFGVMERAGQLPEPPEFIEEGSALKVVYDSPLSRAQKQQDVAAIDEMVAFAAQLAEAGIPSADNLDFDKMVRFRAKFKGLPLDLLRTEEDVADDREAQAQAAQAAAQAEQGQELLGAAQAMAQLPGGEEVVEQGVDQFKEQVG